MINSKRFYLTCFQTPLSLPSGPGEVSVTVDVQETVEDNIVEIRVKDTGIGIPPERHELIFERFFQNDLPNTIINQGSGIGLAITREFVRIHGGTDSCRKRSRKGKLFYSTFFEKMSGQGVHEVINEPVQPFCPIRGFKPNMLLQASHLF
jgi:hypothetical protein